MKQRLKVLILNSTKLTQEFIAKTLYNYKEINILIINYSIDIDESSITQTLSSKKFKSFKIFSPKTKNIEVIKNKVNELKEDDIVLVMGIENLFIDTAKNTYTLTSKNKTTNYKSNSDIDFIEVMSFIDYLYESNTNLLFLFTSQENISQKVIKELEDYDVYILYEDNSNEDELIQIRQKIIKAINETPYLEAIEIIEKHKTNLAPSSYRQAKVSIWLKHGYTDKAITLLTDNYDSLHPHEKVSLGEVFYYKGKYHEAFNIIKPLFEENPLIINIPFLMSKLSIELNCFDEWYQKIIEVNNQDVKVLDVGANYFTKEKNYKEAINLRNQLFSITQDPSHLLLIEVLKVEEEKPKDGKVIEQNIAKVINNYKGNVHLESEANFKLGEIWFYDYKNLKKSFSYFKKNLKAYNASFSFDSVKYCMQLLSTQNYIEQIQPKNSHPDKVPNMRVNILLDSIIILTHDNEGYIIWEDFIDKAQSIEIWEKYLSKKLMSTLKKLDKDLIQSYIEKASIHNEPKELEYAIAVRGYFDAGCEEDGTLKSIADAMLMHTSSIKEKIWTRYYLAINLIQEGEMQSANNQAISLWHLANEIQNNEQLSKLARYLGILSWGILQTKNHKYIEGISCIMVTIEYLINEEQEVYPFIENTLRVLNIWIVENQDLFSVNEVAIFNDLFKSLVPNQEKNNISQLAQKSDWNTIYNELGYKIYNAQVFNSEWGLDFYYYNLAALNLNKFDLKLVLANIYNLIEALSSRLDTREKLLYGMSYILFKSPNTEDTFKQKYIACLQLLSMAIEDIEKKRKQFTNSYERAFLSDEHRKTYKLYLTINLIFYKMNIFFPSEQKLALNIINTFDYVSPRTIKEQKENLLNTNLTDEIKKIEKEYKVLYGAMSLFSLNATKEDYLTKEYKERSNKYLKLKKILEEKHPAYKQDSYFESIPIQLIQMSLAEDEIYYQYVDTGMFIASFIITKKFVSFDLNKNTKLTKDIDILSKELQGFTKSTLFYIDEIHNTYFQLSKKYFGLLLSIYDKHKFKKIYINPDLTKPLLSSNLIRLKNNWLIEEVDFIVNITSKNYFIDRNESRKTNFKIVNMGKESNKQMKETQVWINKDENRKNIFIDDFENNFNKISLTKENSLLIVSHGIQGTFDNNLTGSIQIDGANKSYTIDELKFLNKIDCIYFLTCSSGSVSIGEHETSNSILNNLLSKNVNSAILCKWDVFLDVSLEISDTLINLSQNMPIDYALNQALRETLANRKYQHPVYWAGIEIWKN